MNTVFDVIIVGAGSAGCVLANRLSRDPACRVLLLEAGGWDSHPLVGLPVGARKVHESGLFQWGDVSEPVPALDNRQMAVPHGKIIGGSSSLNYMAVIRGEAAAFDKWVDMGAEGWGYDDVLPFFREIESWAGGSNDWRGGDGEVGVGKGTSLDPIHDAMEAALKNLGYPVNPDFNADHLEGFGRIQYNIRSARRASSARAFLRPVMKRRNLTVQTGAQVTSLLFEGKRVVGVDYTVRGERRTARSTDRTVLSCGAINTPHVLMLSGIGPEGHLKEMGIEPVVDLPVGQGLSDHMGVYLFWTRAGSGPLHASLRLDRMLVSMARAYALRSGSSANLPGVVMNFAKSSPDKPMVDIEFILAGLAPDTDAWFPGIKRAFVDAYYISVWLLGQKSRGEVLLKSSNPLDRPRIIYNALSAPDDLEAMRVGIRRALEMGNAPELQPYRAGPMFPDHDLKSDAEIDAFIRASAMQLYHPASTCAMGRPGESVLDADLKVRGLDGLYVVDASAMPALPGGGPNIVCMMMGARAAAMWRR